MDDQIMLNKFITRYTHSIQFMEHDIEEEGGEEEDYFAYLIKLNKLPKHSQIETSKAKTLQATQERP